MNFTIVITTYNRADVLRSVLQRLENQQDGDFQVVVSVDGSTDATIPMLRSIKTSYELKWVDTGCKEYGLAVARNRGILAAEGEAVVILDDDSVPTSAFVAAHKASVKPGVLTGGPRDPSDPVHAPRMAWKMAELRRLPPLTPMAITELRRTHPTAYLIENNLCMLKEDWIAMGMFSERLKMYGFIGQEFFARADYLGIQYQFNPAAAVVHHGEIEGDNSFHRSKKNRQLLLATYLRPSLMTPKHYQAQIHWAQAAAAGRETPQMPPYIANALAFAPYRLAREAVRAVKRPLRSVARRVWG